MTDPTETEEKLPPEVTAVFDRVLACLKQEGVEKGILRDPPKASPKPHEKPTVGREVPKARLMCYAVLSCPKPHRKSKSDIYKAMGVDSSTFDRIIGEDKIYMHAGETGIDKVRSIKAIKGFIHTVIPESYSHKDELARLLEEHYTNVLDKIEIEPRPSKGYRNPFLPGGTTSSSPHRRSRG
ncbi:MAG: hypothetical protein EBR02_08405 [Alphaproteobacteria bacterium]|nr:hypothetical protein [Alphaproteobacteria bacterium]